MPRRNNRDARVTVPPLDLTPPKAARFTAPQPLKPGERPPSRGQREHASAVRQREARIRNGIDWNVCLVPGCGEELKFFGLPEFGDVERRDPTRILPLCLDHQMIVWLNVQATKHEPLVIEVNQRTLAQIKAEDEAKEEAARQRRTANINGHIYFVRLNGLVKAGWSRDVHERLRAYGPQADVLCIYPGSRDDETNLHRQLRPVLARGREWYEDCQVVIDFVAQAIKRHGPPVTYDAWTKPKQIIKARRTGR